MCNDVLYFLQFNHNQLEHWEDIDQLTQSKGMKTACIDISSLFSTPVKLVTATRLRFEMVL